MKQEFKKVFSGFSLKLICLVTMITGMLLVQLNAPFYGTDLQTKKTETLLKLGYNLYYIGVPIACFLAAEAVVKTKNVGKLLLRLFIAAVVTEFVFDLAKYGSAMMMQEEMPPMNWPQMGRYMYTARLKTFEEAQAFIQFVQGA